MSKVCFSFLFGIFSFPCIAQVQEIKGPSLLYGNFFENDFQKKGLSRMSAGLGINYIKGYKKNVDFVFTFQGCFTDSAIKQQAKGNKKLFAEGKVAVRYRLTRNPLLQPFLTGGLASVFYASHRSVLVSPGIGLQMNLKGIYLFVQSQYERPLSSAFIPYLQYGVGIGGQILKRKTKRIPHQYSIALPERKDRDGDGIADSLDVCPDVPGLADFCGCPDSDGDNIPDKEDRCPTVKGLVKYGGCPATDTDGDGIVDDEDSCVATPGFAKYQGCPVPDRDGDGVNDEEDLCVSVPGIKENKGCPAIGSSLIDSLTKAAKNILFATGSDELLPSSFKALNAVAAVLLRNQSLHLRIDGHTDDVGADKDNQLLSEKRTTAVANYLVSQNVLSSRIYTAGYGASRPTATNKTAQGRAANRRVEFKLFY